MQIPKDITEIYETLKSDEERVIELAKKLKIEIQVQGIKNENILELITQIQKNISSMNEEGQSSDNFTKILEIATKLSDIDVLLKSTNYSEEYNQELRSIFAESFNNKVQSLIQKAKISKLDDKIKELDSEKISIIDRILGKKRFQEVQKKNLEIRKRLESLGKPKECVSIEESLSDLYAYIELEPDDKYLQEINEFLGLLENNSDILQNVNSETFKKMISDKIMLQSENNNSQLIKRKGKFSFFRNQAELLEKENSDFEKQYLVGKSKSRNVMVVPQFKTSEVINKFINTLKQIKEITSQGVESTRTKYLSEEERIV